MHDKILVMGEQVNVGNKVCQVVVYDSNSNANGQYNKICEIVVWSKTYLCEKIFYLEPTTQIFR